MRMKTLSFVMGAALGAAATQVNADALLAPFFYQNSATGAVTLYALKTTGAGVAGSNFGATHNLHFNFFYKDQGANPWEQQTSNCKKDNAYGKVSSYDMVYGSVNGGNAFFPADQSFSGAPEPYLLADPAMGFMIIVEEDGTGAGIGPEGGFSGFGYVVGVSGNSFLEYKMLNNPADTTGTNWDHPTIAKTFFDMSWWPTGTATNPPFTNPLPAASGVNTAWPTIVVGNNMLNGTWQGSLTLTGYAGSWSKNLKQVYNNDEVLYSTQVDKPITCAGWVTRDEIMSIGAERSTRNGGWGRYTVANLSGGTNLATGAFMMKWEENSAAQSGLLVETSSDDPANFNMSY